MNDFNKLLPYAFRYLKHRSRTIAEMRGYLIKKAENKNFQVGTIDEVINYLQEKKFLNDALFVKEYVEYRLNTSPRGRYRLRVELLQKGVSDELVENYFEHNPIDEEVHALQLVKKRAVLVPREKVQKEKERCVRLLQRRGFDSGVIYNVIEECFQKE